MTSSRRSTRAFWAGGALLYVPKGVKIEAPLFSLIGLAGDGRVDLSHTLVVLEEGAEATLVREMAGREGGQQPSLHVGAVEVFLAQNARLRLVNIQNWDETTWHFSRERAFVGRDASLQWTIGALGSRLSKVNQEVALTGPGASAQVNGVMFTSGRQHLAYFTRQDHIAPHTTSDLLYRGGLKDRSRIVWKGMIRVEREAQRTDAYQKNDNLVLSESARADSIPGLEIEANDVRCTHGATAGRVDEDMIFYAQARGIPREAAIRLIVEGFFADVYDRIDGRARMRNAAPSRRVQAGLMTTPGAYPMAEAYAHPEVLVSADWVASARQGSESSHRRERRRHLALRLEPHTRRCADRLARRSPGSARPRLHQQREICHALLEGGNRQGHDGRVLRR